jgi:hypothetical protein
LEQRDELDRSGEENGRSLTAELAGPAGSTLLMSAKGLLLERV